ncbi:MAG: SDR family oxidoreductase [Bacteroidetes bacterium]|nr:SDR family oxidoreductase [Bacteroidota bacterium]
MNSPEENITERKAVITGGSSGIGLATAELFSSLNIKVVSADLKPPGNPSPGIYHFNVDVSRPEDINMLYKNVVELVGHPDILICNAGKGIHEKLSEGDPEKWAGIIETNLMGALRVIRAFVPDMIKNGSGDVVFISSVSAEKPYEWGGVYSATKIALEAIAESLRLEVQPSIRVTTIVPGVVDTAFFKNMIGGPNSLDEIGYGALNAAEVADAIVYAISRPKGVAMNKMVIRPAAQPF